jgi:RNA polymerase sigma factor (sigma-70 family)
MPNRLNELLDAHGPGLHALLLRVTLDREAAEELFQELFARLGESAGFAAADDYPAFAYRTAINLSRDWRRRLRRRSSMQQLPVELQGLPKGADLAQAEQVARVLDAVARLVGPAQDAVCLRFLMQMSYEEVGRMLGRSAHQARALCHAGLSRVRRALSAESRERPVSRVTSNLP